MSENYQDYFGDIGDTLGLSYNKMDSNLLI